MNDGTGTIAPNFPAGLGRFSSQNGLLRAQLRDGPEGLDIAIAELGRKGVIEKARAVVGDGPTFVSFDIDALDMAYVRGTQMPEPGELTVKDAMAILRGFSGLDVIGGDVAELLPPKDPSGHTAVATLDIAFDILCLIAEARAKR